MATMDSHPFSVPDGDRDSARPEQASHPETFEADAAEPHALVPESGKHSNPSSGRSGDRDTTASLLSSMQTVQATSVGTSENDPETSDNDAATLQGRNWSVTTGRNWSVTAPLELEYELHGDAPISTDALLAMPQGVEQNANHEDDDANQHPLRLQREAASPPALQQNAKFRRECKHSKMHAPLKTLSPFKPLGPPIQLYYSCISYDLCEVENDLPQFVCPGAAMRIRLTNKLANSVDSRIYR